MITSGAWNENRFPSTLSSHPLFAHDVVIFGVDDLSVNVDVLLGISRSVVQLARGCMVNLGLGLFYLHKEL